MSGDLEPAFAADLDATPVPLTDAPSGEPIDLAVAAARRVIDALLRADRGRTADLAEVTRRLDATADLLNQHAPPLSERMDDMWHGPRQARYDPITGSENALALPLAVNGLADGSVAATVTVPIAYQGPPGNVHGGVLAGLLDHVLGLATVWRGVLGRTAQLNLRYHRPSPLFDALTVTARCVTIDGRKVRAEGEIRNSRGEICVSAEGLFITAPSG